MTARVLVAALALTAAAIGAQTPDVEPDVDPRTIVRSEYQQVGGGG